MSCGGVSLALSAKVSPRQKLALIVIGDNGGGDDGIYYAPIDHLRKVLCFDSEAEINAVLAEIIEAKLLIPVKDDWGQPGFRFNPRHPAFDQEDLKYVG